MIKFHTLLLASVLTAAAPLLALLATPVLAQRQSAVTPEQMRRHIDVLSSHEYEGRKPAAR